MVNYLHNVKVTKLTIEAMKRYNMFLGKILARIFSTERSISWSGNLRIDLENTSILKEVNIHRATTISSGSSCVEQKESCWNIADTDSRKDPRAKEYLKNPMSQKGKYLRGGGRGEFLAEIHPIPHIRAVCKSGQNRMYFMLRETSNTIAVHVILNINES